MHNKNTISVIFALAAQFIFGFSFMFTKIALGFATPMTVMADRYIVAFISLSAVILIKKIRINFKGNILKLMIMAFFQPVIYFLCESYGIKLTTSGFSSVMISLIPVASVLGGIIFLKEFPSFLQYVFSVISVLGVGIMAYGGKIDGTVTKFGIVLLLGAVIASVAYNILSRKISRDFTPFERTYTMMTIGFIVFVFISFAENINNPLNMIINFKYPLYTASVLYLGGISSVVAFLFLNYANTYLPVSRTTAFSNITTIVSVLAGILFLGEKLSIVTIISSVMIIIGVWGVQMADKK